MANIVMEQSGMGHKDLQDGRKAIKGLAIAVVISLLLWIPILCALAFRTLLLKVRLEVGLERLADATPMLANYLG